MNATNRGLLLILLVTSVLPPGVRSQQTAAGPACGTGQECTSFCLDNNGYAVYGTNLDYMKDRHDGLVFVNKRSVSKSFPQPDSLSRHVEWTSRYGSVSFNLIASQTPWGGMNEAGLVISLMRLEGSRCPERDHRPWIQVHYWMQYVLDNFSTIEEVVASDSAVRAVASGRVPHYLVCDRYGNCATIEFLEGTMVTHAGRDLPVKVLANTPYSSSIAEWRGFLRQTAGGQRHPPAGTSSRARFIRAAERVKVFEPADPETAVRTAFDILEDAGGQKTHPAPPPPCWSVVFDTKNLRVHFRTIAHSEIRTIDFRELDFACGTTVRMLDINERLSGDVSRRMKDYSLEWHLEHAVRTGKKWGLEMSPEELRELFRSYGKWTCR